MDFVFIGGAIALWAVMALLVKGFEKLEKPQAGRA